MHDIVAQPFPAWRLHKPAFAAGGRASALARIGDPAIDLALWRRPRPLGLDWLDELDWDAIDDIDCGMQRAQLAVELPGMIADAGYPAGRQAARLAAEVRMLAERFARLVDRDDLRIRLEIVETDACRRFHADVVTARLLTTLSGRGTQWIETAAPHDLHEMQAGEVAIFKGRLATETPAILHRSPPIGGSGDKRLLLAINPLAASD